MSVLNSRLTIILITFLFANILFGFIDYLRGQEINWLYNLLYSTFVTGVLSLQFVDVKGDKNKKPT